MKDHSARELCEMDSSWGPDFHSVPEGLHCDMCSRELLGLCGLDGLSDGDSGEECFDLEKRWIGTSLTKRLEDRKEHQTLGRRVKSYLHVGEWEE